MPWVSLEYWNMTYWNMLPGYSTSQQVYTRYILHIAGIPTYVSLDKYPADGTQRYTRLTFFCYCMIVLMSTPFTAFILCTLCTHCMRCYCHIDFTYTKRIHLVYSLICYALYGIHLYSPLYYHIIAIYIYPPGIQLHVYTWFHFHRLSIRPSFIYAFSSVTFCYCPSRLRMLAYG